LTATFEFPADHGGPDGGFACSGAEVVGVVERFRIGVFTGALATVAIAAAGALALIPARDSAQAVALTTPTVLATALLVLVAPLAIWRAAPLYWRLRRTPELLAVPVALAAALVSYPLRSELWWPACALLMLVATLVSLRTALVACGAALLANLVAHALAGDLDTTPAVAILGLWVGLPFWSATASIFSEQIACHLQRLLIAAPPVDTGPMRVSSWTEPEAPDGPQAPPTLLPGPSPRASADSPLTSRQLEVIALLADGQRYAEVADCLAISVRQVRRHVENASARLGAGNANELIALAAAQGLAPSGPPG